LFVLVLNEVVIVIGNFILHDTNNIDYDYDYAHEHAIW
jgi:hypothetical protein